MNIRKIIGLSFLCCAVFMACNDDDDDAVSNAYEGASSQRIKRITGENAVWGNYRLDFTYESDGRLKEGIRTDAGTGDTTGRVEVKYDQNYHRLEFFDYMYSIDEEGIAEIQEKYPDTWQDSVASYFVERSLCYVEQKGDSVLRQVNRPSRNEGTTAYVNVSRRIEMPDRGADGQLRAIRCFDDKYGDGSENNYTTREVYKYVFRYDGGELDAVECYRPDAYSETNFTKLYDYACTNYSGTLSGVESELYKMRRGGRTVVGAEPGKNTTYTLDENGLAVKMECTDGSTAAFEYEKGSGNFYELFAMPLDRMLGKVWVR